MKKQVCLLIGFSLFCLNGYCSAPIQKKPTYSVSKTAATKPQMKTLVIPSPYQSSHPVKATQSAPTTTVAPIVQKVDPIVTGTVKLHPFHRLVIQGPFDIEILGSQPQQDLRYIGNHNYIQKILVRVSQDTLYVTLPVKKDKHTNKIINEVTGRATLIVRGTDIQDLQYVGSGKLTAIGLRSPFLSVALKNKGSVEIRGKKIRLQHLDLQGSGPVMIKELDAPHLSLNIAGRSPIILHGKASLETLSFSGNCDLTFVGISSSYLKVQGSGATKVRLTGDVDTLEMSLTGRAHFDGHYLKTRKAYVKTYDNSRADIQVTEYQSTLASDHSNIFYYRKARHHGDYMHRSGAVLQFDDLENES